PSSDAQDVIVTGSFDGWSSSTHLTKTSSGFEGTARVPYGAKVAYKYIVDGRWTTADGQPTEFDPVGNVNNVYSAPAAP
ncbi:carbohydrate-binding module family 48 protein, partial [Daedalea quercina L-15889]